MNAATPLTSEHEKNSAALSSVGAAIFLTTLKLIIGLMTGSLGILSEAAHSGLDLAAALMTFFAVRVSGKPPDEHHTYGHGKVENLSALAETLLLLATCVWIIFEAYDRLFVHEVKVDASIWAFAVMAVSIGVDVTRSRMLSRVAHKYNSQALEADALHFGTDIWSSSVVIVGLIGIKLADYFPGLAFLAKADAVAALVVALIVVWVSLQLGKKAIDALLDRAPQGLAARIEAAVEAIPGIVDCHAVRLRPSGPHSFADLHVLIAGDMKLEQVHLLTEQVEAVVGAILPGVEVVVHAEPHTPDASPRSTPAG